MVRAARATPPAETRALIEFGASLDFTERKAAADTQESDSGLYMPALESLRTLIKTSTSSMTSVPKPLKFLRPHYEEMGKIRESWSVELKEQRVRYVRE